MEPDACSTATSGATISGVISDVHHVGIAVRDMEEACALFRDALHLPVVKEGVAPARGARVMMMGVGGSYLELIQPVAVDSPFAAYIRDKGEGLHHIALWSGDVELEVERLAEQGVPLEDPEPRHGFTGDLSYLEAEAFDGVVVEVVQPEEELSGGSRPGGRVKRVDHVVLRVPDAGSIADRFGEYFGIETKRKMERGPVAFAFLRPGDVIIEVVSGKGKGSPGNGPSKPRETGPSAELRTGSISGLAFEVTEIDRLTATLKQKGYPIGDPHAALQGGRIVSVHPTGACGVPLAFIDFTDSPGPAPRK